MDITNELIKKAKACETAEELIALAKENDIELSAQDAEFYLRDFAEGEISDEELDNVAGGQDGCAKPDNPYETIFWKSAGEVQFLFNKGDIVQAFAEHCSHHTATCKVVNRMIEDHGTLGFCDAYWLEKEPGVRAPFVKGWKNRSSIEK